jgi:hypothetical protein
MASGAAVFAGVPCPLAGVQLFLFAPHIDAAK